MATKAKKVDPLDRWYTLAERLVVALEKLATEKLATAVETAPEPPSWTIWLRPITVNKIAAIKLLRELTCLGLKEAKDVSEGIPLHGLSRELADKIHAELNKFTAVKVQPSLNPLDVHLSPAIPRC